MLEHLAGGNPYLALWFSIVIVSTVFLGGVSLYVMFAIWWERKVSGHVQSRVGPMHTGGWHGWSQSIADGIKLILKEDLIPAGADRLLFRLAPYLAFAPVFAATLALPFGPQFVFEKSLHIGVLYLLAVLSVEVMSTILAGWGSNSKWSIYGAMREACQMVSYEVPLGIAIITGVLVAGTLNLVELSYVQGAGFHAWLVFANPFIFMAFGIYFCASLASNKRAPFDLPESESELVAGFHTEYSGLRWSFFFFAEYAAMLVVGAIQAALFLGGWNSPLGAYDPVYMLLGYDPVKAGELYFSGVLDAATEAGGWAATADALGMSSLGLVALNVYCALIFIVKALLIVFVQIWLRWTLPRIRIDQVLYACVKVLLPASLLALLGAAFWVFLVDDRGPVTLMGPEGEAVQSTVSAHLLGEPHWLQSGAQVVLAMAGAVVVLAALLTALLAARGAVFGGPSQPRKTLYDDVIPVGDRVAFTRPPHEQRDEPEDQK